MYELFVLGELFDQPLHGYLLRDIISIAIGPVRQMSWGALYPLIQRLEDEGLIAPDEATTSAAGGRQRKVYRITEAGRQRFFHLLLKPGEYNADYPDLFSIKLSNFDHLSVEQQLAVLRHYRGFVQYVHEYMENQRQFVSVNEYMPDAERPHVLRMIDYRLRLSAAELAWLDDEIVHTAAGTDAGLSSA